MKVAFIVNSFPKLSETFILSQIVGLKEQGLDIDIFPNNQIIEGKVHSEITRLNLLTKCYYLDIPNNKIIRLLKSLKLMIKYVRRLPTLLRSLNFIRYGKDALSLKLFYHTIRLISKNKYEYDVILCHFGMNGHLAVRLKEIGVLKGKIITVFHGFDITKFLDMNGNNYYNNLFLKGDLFLPISNNWATKLVELGCPPDKTMVHRMGVDTDKFEFQLPTFIKGDTLKVVSVARLVEKKGIEYGVKAVIEALKVYPNLEYKIIGDGPLKMKISQIINNSGYQDRIKLIGWRDQEQIIEILKNEADLFLAPSVTANDGDQEGIPVVLMEALARGLPVISTNHSGIPELIKNSKTGYLVPERDFDSLANSIISFIENESESRKMSINGRKVVEKEYNNKILNIGLKNIFKELIKR